MTKLSETEAALLAGGEANLWLRWKARWMGVPFSTSGSGEAAQSGSSAANDENTSEFARLRSELPRFRELPDYFAWDDLSAEMKANILVGVEAGEAVRPRVRHVPIGWKAGLAFTAIALVMVSGYWWRLPGRFTPANVSQQAILETGPGGLELQESQNTFAVMYDHEASQQTLSGGLGSVRADFVDRDTGQLTVAHVYVD